MARPLLGRTSIRQKRIPHADASPCTVSRVSGHHRQAAGQYDGSDLSAALGLFDEPLTMPGGFCPFQEGTK
jgi:hypothetical protein